MERVFKYDVAFSFLAADEITACEINDKISPPFKSFIYSKKQEEIAFSDGMDSFTNVFLEESRFVVVLYRNGWGKTRWTRVEENAIKSRALNNGWDSLLVVKLDEQSDIPKWVPPFYIYLAFEQYGIDKLITIIQNKIKQLRGSASEESVEDYAKRLKDLLERESRIKRHNDSAEIVQHADLYVRQIFEEVEKTWETIIKKQMRFPLSQKERGQHSIRISSEGISFTVRWERPISNSLEKSRLTIRIFKHASHFNLDSNETIEEAKFQFRLNKIDQYEWFNSDICLSSKQIVDLWLKKFLQSIQKVKLDIIDEGDDPIINLW